MTRGKASHKVKFQKSASDMMFNYLEACAWAADMNVKNIRVTGTGWNPKDPPFILKGIQIEWTE